MQNIVHVGMSPIHWQLTHARYAKAAAVVPLWDPLVVGPAGADVSEAAWMSMRTAFWSQATEFVPQRWPHVPYANRDALEAADAVWFWAGAAAEEQLALVWFVQVYRQLHLPLEKLKLVQFPQAALGQAHAGAIGAMAPDELVRHPPPQTLTTQHLERINAAWDAVISPTPELMLSLDLESPPETAVLFRAVYSLVNHYPHERNGLSFWDELLLRQLIKHQPDARKAVGYAMAEEGPFRQHIHDGWLSYRLRLMAHPSLQHPLVELKAESAHVTEAGLGVLAGHANAVALNGIHDRVAGVHLESRTGDTWYRTDQHRLIRRTAPWVAGAS